MTPEEKLIRAIGDVNDRYLKLAVSYERPSVIRTYSRGSGEVTDNRLPAPKHQRLISVLTWIAVAAVFALVIALGFIWGITADGSIETHDPPLTGADISSAVSSDDPAVSQPEGDDLFPEELHDFVIKSETVGDRILGEVYLQIVFGTYYENDGVISVIPETGRVEMVDPKTGKVWSTGRFVTHDTATGEITLDRDIVIKVGDYGLPYFAAVVCVPIQGSDSYCANIYSTDDYREFIDYAPACFHEIDSPDSIEFEEESFGYVVDKTEHISIGFRQYRYDDNTPYEWLYKGEPYSEGMALRFDSIISDPGRKVRSHAMDIGISNNGLPLYVTPDYVSWEFDKIYYDRSAQDCFTFDNSWIRLKNSDEVGVAYSDFVTENGDDRFSVRGSFDLTTRVLDDGKLLVFAGLPGDYGYTVSVFLYDGNTLRQFPDLFIHLDDTLESIECIGTNRLKYHDFNNGDCDIMLDHNDLTYRAWLSDADETALELLAEYAGTDDYALPLDLEKATLVFNGEAFVQGNKSYYSGDIYSVTDGTVQTVNWIPGHNMYIDILDKNGNLWTYADCGSIANVYEGMEVRAGDKISMNWAGGVQIRFNSPVEPPVLSEPAVNYDMADIEVTGTPYDSSELNKFSVDSYIEKYLGWEAEWSEKSGQENKVVNTGLFIDSLGVPGLKELYYKAYALDRILVTDNFTDLDCYKCSGAVVKKPYPPDPDYKQPFASTGITYESFHEAYFETFTKDMALNLLNNFNNFLRYGDELYIVEVSTGGDLSRVHEEYELVRQTEDEIVFRKVHFRVKEGTSDLTYHPELRDTYEKTYTTFRFVRENGVWKIAYAPEYHW